MGILRRYGRALNETLELIQHFACSKCQIHLHGFLEFGFSRRSKNVLRCMLFRAPHAALKQKNYHNFQNIQPIIVYFLGLLKFIKRHLLTTFSKQLNMFCPCYRHASLFLFFFCIYFKQGKI